MAACISSGGRKVSTRGRLTTPGGLNPHARAATHRSAHPQQHINRHLCHPASPSLNEKILAKGSFQRRPVSCRRRRCCQQAWRCCHCHPFLPRCCFQRRQTCQSQVQLVPGAARGQSQQLHQRCRLRRPRQAACLHRQAAGWNASHAQQGAAGRRSPHALRQQLLRCCGMQRRARQAAHLHPQADAGSAARVWQGGVPENPPQAVQACHELPAPLLAAAASADPLLRHSPTAPPSPPSPGCHCPPASWGCLHYPARQGDFCYHAAPSWGCHHLTCRCRGCRQQG